MHVYFIILTKGIMLDGVYVENMGPYASLADATHALAVYKAAIQRQGSDVIGIDKAMRPV